MTLTEEQQASGNGVTITLNDKISSVRSLTGGMSGGMCNAPLLCVLHSEQTCTGFVVIHRTSCGPCQQIGHSHRVFPGRLVLQAERGRLILNQCPAAKT